MSRLQTASVWPVVHAERHALVRDLTDLSEQDWQTPSLCAGWTVHDVLAHVVDSAKATRRSFVWRMLKSGMNFDKDNEFGVRREKQPTGRETLTALSAVSEFTCTPPANLATRFVEAFVHGEDIRRPLGIQAHYPNEAVCSAIDYQLATTVAMGGGRQRGEGLRLVAEDCDSSWGQGPEVRGRGIDLLLVLSGRPIDSTDLTGEGAATLLSRS